MRKEDFKTHILTKKTSKRQRSCVNILSRSLFEIILSMLTVGSVGVI